MKKEPLNQLKNAVADLFRNSGLGQLFESKHPARMVTVLAVFNDGATYPIGTANVENLYESYRACDESIPAPPALRGDEPIDREWLDYYCKKIESRDLWEVGVNKYGHSIILQTFQAGQADLFLGIKQDSDKPRFITKLGDGVTRSKFVDIAKVFNIDLEANRKAREGK